MVDAVRHGLLPFGGGSHLERIGETYTGTTGDDAQTGTRKNDTFDYSQGGNDELHGARGNDQFFFGAALTSSDIVDGGSGDDQLNLDGFYLNLTPMLTSIEVIALAAGHDYSLILGDANIAAGKTLTVDGSTLGTSNHLNLSATETDGRLVAIGGAGQDSLNGGNLDDDFRGGGGTDVLHGGLGADRLAPGAGTDALTFYTTAESTSRHYDEIVGFDFDEDLIGLSNVGISAIDPTVLHGSLSGTDFDHDLRDAIGNAELHRHHAVLFIPDDGTLAGLTFLIADANGKAGYQPGKDYVFLLTEAHHINHLDASDFYIEA